MFAWYLLRIIYSLLPYIASRMYQPVNPQRQLLILVCLYAVFSASASSLFSIFASANVSHPPKFFFGLFSVVSFLLPALIVRKIFSAKDILQHKQKYKTRSLSIITLSIAAMICSVMVMNWLSNLNQQVPVSESFRQAEAAGMEKQREYMKAGSPLQICYNLLIFSLIPSVCEEAFFRGTMQPLLEKIARKKWLAILITATVFSFFHFQFLGFLPRLFAGIVLGIIFVATKNIFIPIICHIIYNSFVVVVSYAGQSDNFNLSIFEKQLLHPLLVSGSILLVIFFLYLLSKATTANTSEPDL